MSPYAESVPRVRKSFHPKFKFRKFHSPPTPPNETARNEAGSKPYRASCVCIDDKVKTLQIESVGASSCTSPKPIVSPNHGRSHVSVWTDGLVHSKPLAICSRANVRTEFSTGAATSSRTRALKVRFFIIVSTCKSAPFSGVNVLERALERVAWIQLPVEKPRVDCHFVSWNDTC